MRFNNIMEDGTIYIEFTNIKIYCYLLNPPLCFLHLIEGVCVGEKPVNQVKLFPWVKSPGWCNRIHTTLIKQSIKLESVKPLGALIDTIGCCSDVAEMYPEKLYLLTEVTGVKNTFTNMNTLSTFKRRLKTHLFRLHLSIPPS